MKQPFCRFFLVAALLAVAGCTAKPAQSEPSSPASAAAARKFEKVRDPAVAGIFYPKDESVLKRNIERLLAKAKPEPLKNLRALICPHAGYEYSAPIAASSYKLLVGQHFSTVILLGPSHYALFDGAFVSAVDAYRTPLGLIPLSPKAAVMAKISPFVSHPACRVDRPNWVGYSSRKPPPLGEDLPDTWEHSLEVQLPLLQCTLHDFSIVPVVFGEVDSGTVAKRLMPFLDDDTLLIVSTDLSHYHPYEEAKAEDTRTVKAICDLRADLIGDEDACGHAAVVTLIDIARQKGWKAHLLDYRNSGDTTDDKSRVVGYAAIAFTSREARKPTPTSVALQFTPNERRILLRLARKSVTAAVTGGEAPKYDPAAAAKFRERRPCFVTLTRNGDLRGCIGSLSPQESLYQAVISRAKAAATEDPRFDPVRPNELDKIEIEISVLTLPEPLAFASPQDLLEKLRPGIDGVVLSVDGQTATYLPQVWEQLPDKRIFLRELSQKAGLAADAWTSPAATVMTYQVEAFHEERDAARNRQR
jgi:AmmeMemoRadiSam system protein A